jgi:hypothetical protein
VAGGLSRWLKFPAFYDINNILNYLSFGSIKKKII